ncbi:uncharacterized protein LOC27208815 [Drosophila simulans]|uniref:uncharacterized protein LOC27208815 n=1 Tax=Drosophila simulans TaxID=7240 RepID=UPI00078ADEB9|nr:uncharacterized protein LOC27208815 [Drosophila simulans]KMY87079.1 uncharacterized protein Dsimw501_GD28972 [Drosophila simulans]
MSKRNYRCGVVQLMAIMALTVIVRCDFRSITLPKGEIALKNIAKWTRLSTARDLSHQLWDQGWSSSLSPGLGPTPSEVLNAFSVAKLASANVFIAQKQLETAKENVLNQQRIATEKQTQALILKQKSQAASAIYHSAAIERHLAASKSAVARAAANFAAAEIKKTKNEAAKLGHITRNGQHVLSLSPASNHLSISYLQPVHFSSWLNGQSHFS